MREIVVAACMIAATAQAQDEAVRAEGNRMTGECIAHDEAARHSLAAECFLRVYDFAREHGVARAPVALWDAGRNLSRMPGSEGRARGTLQRFLDESTAIADGEDAADIRGWRSEATALIAELDARGGGSISPLGPVVLAAGGGALIVSAILGGVVIARDAELVAMCPGDRCPGSAQALASEIESMALAADVLLYAGAAIAVAGVFLTIFLREGPSASASASCGPLGCTIRGRF